MSTIVPVAPDVPRGLLAGGPSVNGMVIWADAWVVVEGVKPIVTENVSPGFKVDRLLREELEKSADPNICGEAVMVTLDVPRYVAMSVTPTRCFRASADKVKVDRKSVV